MPACGNIEKFWMVFGLVFPCCALVVGHTIILIIPATRLSIGANQNAGAMEMRFDRCNCFSIVCPRIPI